MGHTPWATFSSVSSASSEGRQPTAESVRTNKDIQRYTQAL